MSTKVRGDTPIEQKIRSRFSFLYGDEKASECLERLKRLLSKYAVDLNSTVHKREGWDQSDAVLITYGDVIQKQEESNLSQLQLFLNRYLGDVISTEHILPFFPSSSRRMGSVTSTTSPKLLSATPLPASSK